MISPARFVASIFLLIALMAPLSVSADNGAVPDMPRPNVPAPTAPQPAPPPAAPTAANTPAPAPPATAAPSAAAPTATAAPAPDAPAAAPNPALANEDFGQYLVDHQEELRPFFEKHREDLFKQFIPLFFAVLVYAILLKIVVGWIFNVGIAYGFSRLFAPTHAKILRALVYATGNLVLTLVFYGLTTLLALGVSMINSAILLFLSVVLAIVINFVLQTVWVMAVYRTKAVVAGLFYLSLFGFVTVVTGLVSGSYIEAKSKELLTQFMDTKVTAQLKVATVEVKREADVAIDARDKLKAATIDAQSRLKQDALDEVTLNQQIAEKQKSENFDYVRIVRLHAAGKLAEARDQFNDFLTSFPNGAMSSGAKAQLAQVESEIAAKDAAKKQADDEAAKAADAARAALLDRVRKGGVPLSEMRKALLGKTRAEVSSLFGPPTETASDKWGYAQQIVLNPVTNEKHGLTVYFKEGIVQSIDFYYVNDGAASQ